MYCREEIKSAGKRAAAIMRMHESARRKRMGERAKGGGSGRGRNASDFSSVTVAFRLTASLHLLVNIKKNKKKT